MIFYFDEKSLHDKLDEIVLNISKNGLHVQRLISIPFNFAITWSLIVTLTNCWILDSYLPSKSQPSLKFFKTSNPQTSDRCCQKILYLILIAFGQARKISRLTAHVLHNLEDRWLVCDLIPQLKADDISFRIRSLNYLLKDNSRKYWYMSVYIIKTKGQFALNISCEWMPESSTLVNLAFWIRTSRAVYGSTYVPYQ